MSTHISAAPGQVAPHVLMPGDPLRARWIAENFLEGAECYSQVRGMLGYTGRFRGERVSVQGSGMGLPSLSIYAHELFSEYDVQTIVRVGSCGALSKDLRLRDIVLASGACTDSSMNRIRFEGLDYAPVADFGLLRAAHDAALSQGLPVRSGARRLHGLRPHPHRRGDHVPGARADLRPHGRDRARGDARAPRLSRWVRAWARPRASGGPVVGTSAENPQGDVRGATLPHVNPVPAGKGLGVA
jgi:hypothetical protein